jgi:predicted DNA binding CopG/RHH family protein
MHWHAFITVMTGEREKWTTIRLKDITRHKLKVAAAKADMSYSDFIEMLLKEYGYLSDNGSEDD